MKINLDTSLNFTRRLRANEEADYLSVLQKGKKLVGNTGHSILIVPTASLPQATNTGVGNLLDKESKSFFDFAKQYWGINYIQFLPDGNYRHKGNSFLPYSGSSLDLGSHLINLDLLTTKEFANLLNNDDIKNVVKANNVQNETYVNFENVLKDTSSNESILKKAFNELIKSDTTEKKKLLKEIEEYSTKNKSWLEPKAIYKALSLKYNNSDTRSWNDFDRNLYDTEKISLEHRNSAIEGIKKSELGKEAKFYEFKQFLADKNLSIAKEELNKKGIKLSGDILVGFSYDEIWANPKAFRKDFSIGWGLPALNFEAPEGEKLLREKINLFAKRYDGMRLDASWLYSAQRLENNTTKEITRIQYADKILDIIDDEVKKVKGNSYDLENIMHEFISDLKDYNIYEGTQIKPYIDKRNKIYCSNGMHEDWGSVSNFKNRGWQDGKFVLGTTNHDCIPMRMQYENPESRKIQTEVLSDILKIPREKLQSLNDFINAKFAEPMRAKHNMIFFIDALNLRGRYKDNKPSSHLDYRIKIPTNYQNNYFNSLEKGEGYNPMDALEKAFVAEGLDKKETDLYNKIVKYRKILQEKETVPKGKNNFTIVLVGISGLAILALSLLKNKKAEPKNSNSAKN